MTPRLTPSITDYIPMPSPVGELLLTAKGDSLSGIWFAEQKGGTPLRPDWRPNNASAVLGQARIELAEYFAGTRHRFEIKLRPEGTHFQRGVGWTAQGAIRQDLDLRRAGGPSGKAIGWARCGRCCRCQSHRDHRALPSHHRPRRFTQRLCRGLDRKVRLLAIEGITLPLEA